MFLLVDNHDAFTSSLIQMFAQLGRAPVVVGSNDPALPDMARRDGLAMVCLGPGPGHPRDAGLCRDFLAALPPHVPVLGIGLGHQILAFWAGARVEAGPEILHGGQSVVRHDGEGIFSGLPRDMTVGRYHSLLARAEDAPDVLVVTARTGEAGEVMGLRVRDRPWAGVQFRPESILTPDGMRLLANFPSALPARTGPDPVDSAIRIRSSSPAPVRIASLIEKLAQGRDLGGDEAAAAFARLMDGELSPSQAGALLLGLRAKGETPEEMGEAVNAVLARAIPVPPVQGVSIDIVGVGGDGKNSFNCSTATALTLAGMGHKVLKHGNRSVSSRCGSADVLEQLGVPLDTPPGEVARTLEREGFVFLFAPRYHPSFRHIMPVRRELGIRTLFNILGPLVNPARATHHLFGVSEAGQLSLVAVTLARSGNATGAVVHGAGGYDEITPLGEAEMIFVEGATTRPGRLDPAEYGFAACAERDLAVEGPEQAADTLRDLLRGHGPKPMRDMLALNLGLALYLLGSDSRRDEELDRDRGYNRPRMRAAMEEAERAVDAGAGRRFCHA